jgi:hypothetical protein
MGEFSVLLEFFHTIIDASIFCEVGVSFVEESLDEYLHLRYESRNRCYGISFLYMELLKITEKLLCIILSKLSESFSRFLAVTDRLVVDISDVHHGFYLVPQKSQCPYDKIFKEVRSEIADMSIVIWSRSTVVDLDFVLAKWFELLD